MNKALITGVTGQDDLARLLLDKGYEVYGLIRRTSTAEKNDFRFKWLGIKGRVIELDGDLIDLSALVRIVHEVQPDEVYNLAA